MREAADAATAVSVDEGVSSERQAEAGTEGWGDADTDDAVILGDAVKLAELEAALEVNELAMKDLEEEHAGVVQSFSRYISEAERSLADDLAAHLTAGSPSQQGLLPPP